MRWKRSCVLLKKIWNHEPRKKMPKKEINRLRKKLRQIKNICLTNAKQWDESQHDPVEEFKLLAEIIDEKE